MPTTERVYLIKDNGFWRRTSTDEWIGPEIDAVVGAVPRVPSIVRNFIGDRHKLESQEGITLARRLPVLFLHTLFHPITDVDEKVIMIPVFDKAYGAKPVDMKFQWTVPLSMKLYFIVRWLFTYAAGPRSFATIQSPATSYLAAFDDRQAYKLPLPNLYDDGKLCLGEAGRIDTTKDIVNQFDLLNGVFNNTRWNADLINADISEKSRRLFRFDSQGKCMPQPDWNTHCRIMNHAAYAHLVKLP